VEGFHIIARDNTNRLVLCDRAPPARPSPASETKWWQQDAAGPRARPIGPRTAVKTWMTRTDVHILDPVILAQPSLSSRPALRDRRDPRLHRHMSGFWTVSGRASRAMIVAPRDVFDESVPRSVRVWQIALGSRVMPLPLEDSLRTTRPLPIWQAAPEYDPADRQPQLYLEPPYYDPGYEDLWEHIFLSRRPRIRGAHACFGSFHRRGLFLNTRNCDGRARMLLACCRSGPCVLRAGCPMSGGTTAPLKQKPSEYMLSRPVFCSIRAPRRRGHV